MILASLITFTFLFGAILKVSAWDANNPENIKAYVAYVASKEGVNVQDALDVAHCESRYRKGAIRDSINDPANPKDDEYSVGIFQINILAHTNITKEQALHPWFNINWAIDKLAQGKWSMWRHCSEKYGII